MQSLMEKRMERLLSSPKPDHKPNTLDEGLAEIAYLKAIESMARHRLGILLKIQQSTALHVADLEAQRHKLERLYVPVTHCAPVRSQASQKASPKSREEILKSWEGMPQAECDRLIKMLEDLQKS
jgi:hypothetical protein